MKTVNQTPEHPANEELAAFALGKEQPQLQRRLSRCCSAAVRIAYDFTINLTLTLEPSNDRSSARLRRQGHA